MRGALQWTPKRSASKREREADCYRCATGLRALPPVYPAACNLEVIEMFAGFCTVSMLLTALFYAGVIIQPSLVRVSEIDPLHRSLWDATRRLCKFQLELGTHAASIEVRERPAGPTSRTRPNPWNGKHQHRLLAAGVPCTDSSFENNDSRMRESETLACNLRALHEQALSVSMLSVEEWVLERAELEAAGFLELTADCPGAVNGAMRVRPRDDLGAVQNRLRHY